MRMASFVWIHILAGVLAGAGELSQDCLMSHITLRPTLCQIYIPHNMDSKHD